jgi:peroxiredoxin Q/BCP
MFRPRELCLIRRVSRSIDVGDKIPAFELPDHAGRRVRVVDLLGRGPLVFFFYPRDETPGCTKEVCGFRDAHAELMAAGAQVFGISSDPIESHRQFVEKFQLPYPLLADVGGQVRHLFGVPRSLLGFADGRVTYVTDAAGIVVRRYVGMFQATRHVEEALEAVRAVPRA